MPDRTPLDNPEIRGTPVDQATRCTHWQGWRDVVAFRFPCCEGWFPCRACHDETVEHEGEVWGADQHDQAAVMCGACRQAMTIATYVACEHACPACGAAFNPGCGAHWERYFEVPSSKDA